MVIVRFFKQISFYNLKYVYKFNIGFLFGFNYYYFCKYYIMYPLLLPRNDSIFIISFIYKFLSKKFFKKFFEAGVGSAVFIFFFNKISYINVFGVDLIINSFFNFYENYFNFIKDYLLSNCDWLYIFISQIKFNIIFSNPPYLSEREFEFFFFLSLHEYKYSLTAKHVGFFDLSLILRFSYYSLLQNGVLFIEHGYLQKNKLKKISKISGFINFFSYKNNDRNYGIIFCEK